MIKQKLKNIGSVSKYESKLLTRSWFFKIFAIIIFLITAGLIAAISSNNKHVISAFQALPTIVPYVAIMYLNIAQSFVIIFLSADYLKRDKQLDTSEVFYVRPLSNAEYLLGKMWGTIKPFLIFNTVFLALLFCVIKFVLHIDCTAVDFVIYYFIITIPSLIFITGASTALMLTIGNQAVTFIVMLGLSVLSLMYGGKYVDGLFDIFVFKLPITKSSTIGITSLSAIINHRLIYAIIGIASILFSISLFKRLAGTKSSKYGWMIASIATYVVAGVLLFSYYISATNYVRVRERVIELNTKYADYPKLQIDNYNIDITQQEYSIGSCAKVSGTLSKDAKELVFTLNSGMNVSSVSTIDSTALKYKREGHLVIVELKEELKSGDSLSLCFNYSGAINEDELYVDIKGEYRDVDNKVLSMFMVDKKGAIIKPEWVVLTPESNWYIKPGVTYSDKVSNWRGDYFSNFSVNVKPLRGQTPVIQGAVKLLKDSLTYNFTTDKPLRAISLAISNYKEFTTTVDSVDYSLYIHKSNLNKISILDSIRDTIPNLIKEMKGDFERMTESEYTFNRFTIVDAPEQLFSYARSWSATQEIAQPELLFVPGCGATFNDSYNLQGDYDNYKRASDRGWIRPPLSDKAIKVKVFTNLIYSWHNKDVTDDWQSSAGGNYSVIKKANPHYLPALLFDSRFNVISDSLPLGNQLVETLYSSYNNVLKRNLNWRNQNGMSDLEQIFILLQEEGCSRYISDSKYSKFTSEFIVAQINYLFAEAMNKMGADEFDEYFRELIDNSEYKNITLEMLLDSVSQRSGVSLKEKIKDINAPLALPAFFFEDAKVKESYLNDEPIFSSEFVVSNISNVTGYIQISYTANDETKKSVIKLAPKETKRIVKHHLSNVPRITVNTMNSSNVPQAFYMKVNREDSNNNIRRGRMKSRAKVTEPLEPEGEYIIKNYKIVPDNEIIVDNEDKELFSVSAPASSGYLNRWIDKSMSSEYKYMSPYRRAPYKWTPISNSQYYGTSILSGLMIRGDKSGGSQYVEWKIPVESGNRYSLYFSTKAPDELRWRRHSWGGSKGFYYNFTIDDGEKRNDIIYDFTNLSRDMLRGGGYSWEWIGDFRAKSDTISVRLSNKSNIYKVNADAVKAVKMN